MSAHLLSVVALLATASASPSAIDLFQDMYHTCLQDLSVGCVKPKALYWLSAVSDKPEIRITSDLVIVKKPDVEQRSNAEDIFDRFDDFLQTHDIIAKVPQALRPDGILGGLMPRSFQAEDVKAPLAVTGRSKLVKKVIVPFLLGLKFKTAVLVPLALALIALKTWKALTLGLLSLVLTGAMLIFKLSKPKVNYEVVHFPHHHDHHEHHVDHLHLDHQHIEHPPVVAGWEHQAYGRQMNAQEMAYEGQMNN